MDGANSASLTGQGDWVEPGSSGTTPTGGEWVLYDGLLQAGGTSQTWRYNNPGSLHYTPFARRHGAYTLADWSNKMLAIFPDPQTGWDAMIANLRAPGYAGKRLTFTQLMRKWVGWNNTDWLNNVLAWCKKQQLAVTADSQLDPDWDEATFQKVGTAIAHAEGFYVEGTRYFDGDANLPDWVVAIFARRTTTSFTLTLTPPMEANAAIGCCDKKDPGSDDPNIRYMIAISATWDGLAAPVPCDFPANATLQISTQDQASHIELKRKVVGVYQADVYATICESMWVNVHATLSTPDEGLAADKSHFQVPCDP